jgi:hypothetical protein
MTKSSSTLVHDRCILTPLMLFLEAIISLSGSLFFDPGSGLCFGAL